jgi:hypothetical protein
MLTKNLIFITVSLFFMETHLQNFDSLEGGVSSLWLAYFVVVLPPVGAAFFGVAGVFVAGGGVAIT